MVMESKLEIKKRLHKLFADKKTDCAKSIYMNPVNQYIDLDRFDQEKEEIFKNQPICIGTSSLIPKALTWTSFSIFSSLHNFDNKSGNFA